MNFIYKIGYMYAIDKEMMRMGENPEKKKIK